MEKQMVKCMVIVPGCSEGKKGAIKYAKSMNYTQMTTKNGKKDCY